MRNPQNCSLIKRGLREGIGAPQIYNDGKCMGYSHSEDTGMPAHKRFHEKDFFATLSTCVFKAAREAAVLELIAARDKITAQLKELGLEE